LNEGATRMHRLLLQPCRQGSGGTPTTKGQPIHHKRILCLGQTSETSNLNSPAKSISFLPFVFPALLFLAQHFQRTKPENPVAGDPARRRSQHSCPKERGQRGGPLDVKAHIQLVQQHLREQVREDYAD